MTTEIQIPIGSIALAGSLVVPPHAIGLVMFAHGSGSSRHSPRNRHVAAILNEHRLATLLFDLLTLDEERIDAIDATLRFDVEMLAERLVEATDSVAHLPGLEGLPIGYFGGSTGAAAALLAAARRPELIAAVVSRGGRPDLASRALAAVRAPTLLIVGGADPWVLQVNRVAASQLTIEHRVVVVPNATHLFEEPGALDQVAQLAAGWFVDHLAAAHVKHAS
ncbi:MAG TPA: dienelactone hydrolase family protein [Kofleriaceae bacterium]|nr:dienelactone hydrolase family protein [Kofleriaceae bacterium]